MFNQISRANFPIFIDDYESCADYDFINEYSKHTQIILSKVEKGHPLTISDYNSTKATVIKPVISKVKTFKTQKDAPVSVTGSFHKYLEGGFFNGDLKYDFKHNLITGII